MSMASYVDPEIRPCLLIEIQGYLFMLYSRFLFCSRKSLTCFFSEVGVDLKIIPLCFHGESLPFDIFIIDNKINFAK